MYGRDQHSFRLADYTPGTRKHWAAQFEECIALATVERLADF